MFWLTLLVKTVIDWLLEIPPDLFGRSVEHWLDRMVDRRVVKRRRRSRISGKQSVARKRRRRARLSS